MKVTVVQEGKETYTVDFSDRKKKFITIDELKEAFKTECSSKSDNENYHKYSDGWLSTSLKTPEKGGIFMPVTELCVVEFRDKYKRQHTGIITQFSYDSYDDSVSITVKADGQHDLYNPEWSAWFNAYNYGLSIKQIKVIEGKMPTVPNKPTFK